MMGTWPPIPALATASRPDQIAGYYRKLILDGHIGEHEQLPTAEQIAQLWDVSVSTARRGITQLRLEGLAYSNTQGVFVASQESHTSGMADR
jgi:DNA-binding GntR family transcriptional regulator